MGCCIGCGWPAATMNTGCPRAAASGPTRCGLATTMEGGASGGGGAKLDDARRA